MVRRPFSFALVVLAAACSWPAAAQDAPDLEDLARQLRRNQEELRQYTWQSTVTYLVDGVQRRQDVYSVRYDDGGRLEKMQVGSTVAKGALRGPDGKKLKKDELESAREFAQEVREQLFGYLSPMFAEKAVLAAEATRRDGALVLRSGDVMTDGDAVEIVIDTTTARPSSATISGTAGGSPVSLELQFGHQDYGPSFPVRSVTRSTWQGLELTIVTEDSGHTRR